MQTEGSSDIFSQGWKDKSNYFLLNSLWRDFTLSFFSIDLWSDPYFWFFWADLSFFLADLSFFLADLSFLCIDVELINLEVFYMIDNLYLLYWLDSGLFILGIYFWEWVLDVSFAFWIFGL